MSYLPITIYTQPTCQTCHRLKKFLVQKSIEYRERDVTKDEEALAELQRLGFSSTPILLIGGEIVVGFDQAKLERLLSQ